MPELPYLALRNRVKYLMVYWFSAMIGQLLLFSNNWGKTNILRLTKNNNYSLMQVFKFTQELSFFANENFPCDLYANEFKITLCD